MSRGEVTLLRSATLSHRKPTRFRVVADEAQRVSLAAGLGLIDLVSARLEGALDPAGRADFVLTARLQAEAVQACVVSLAPVPARVDETVTRRYLAELALPEGDEVEMPEDDSAEPLPEEIDLIEVLRESLALALPLYPRAEGAELGAAVFAAPGVAPLQDEDLKPFAGLAGLVAGRDPAKG